MFTFVESETSGVLVLYLLLYMSKDYGNLVETSELQGKMSETVVNDRHFETVDAVHLSHQPTVDMGTPVDVINVALRLDSGGGCIASAGMPPLLRSDDVVKTEIGELKPVDSMPHLMPMITDTSPIQKKDDDTENWVSMVRQ